jgi:hypothetical protein
MFSKLFVSLLVTRGARIAEVFIRCEEVPQNGTPGERGFLLKSVKASHTGVSESLVYWTIKPGDSLDIQLVRPWFFNVSTSPKGISFS